MDYGCINAKVRAMHGRLMTRDDFDALSRSKTVEECSQRLKDHPEYKVAIQDVAPDERRRSVIERKLLLSLAADFQSIYRFITDYKLKKFLDSYFLKNEVYIIKMLLSLVYDAREIVYSTEDLDLLLGEKLNTNLPKLKAAKSVYEFIEALNGTRLYAPLSSAYTEKYSIFELETQLDLHYYSELWKAMDDLDPRNKKVMKRLIGTETDLKNILWIYRLKTYYKVADSTIYAYLIPHNYKLNAASIKRMVEAKTTEDLMNEISSGPYAKAFLPNTLPDKSCALYLNKLLVSLKTADTNSLGATISYIYKKEQEIFNLTTMIEALRYGLSPEEAMKLIVLENEANVV